MNKRGSHVGMVLSFVIFVTFLFFIYTILSPSISVEKSKQDLLAYLKLNLVESLSDNVTLVTIRIKDNVNMVDKNCIILEHPLINSEGYTVKNYAGTNLKSSTTGNNLYINWAEGNNLFFKIYYSNQFSRVNSNTNKNCILLTKSNHYEIGSVVTSEYVFVSKVNVFKKNYINNYEEIKKSFNFPNVSDFDFNFDLGDGRTIGKINENVPANVYAEEVPVQYMEDTQIKYGFLKLRVW
jgi:hypothetical protein